ncbi:hypothetical protein [Pseudooceanicola sp. HF7]|uniref:hypothetical protein n=1 Tax=Pseudooceanicola sp. HF7 TaxID=2721560 RepID=UPI0014309A3B|nr:hypothetical protein [Pseudooceanicola sp. HF7]NIZ09755.1 hypothetical protein [Pseudooceanicola sp. HF7]
MSTYRISLGRPGNPPGVYNFAQTVVAPSPDIAIGRAYEAWIADTAPPTPPVPPLSQCTVSVRRIGQTEVLANVASTSAQEEFANALEDKVGQFLGSRLDGTFQTVAYPSGFNYGITYGSNAYWNAATLQDFDTLLGTSSSGQLELVGGRFSTFYSQILGAVAFDFSSADQQVINEQDTAASAQIASILREFENAGGTYSSPLPFGGKLQDVFNQLTEQYGAVDKLPDTLNALRNAIASYKSMAGASYALHNRYYQATARLSAARANVLAPSETNGGQEVSANTYYVGYTPNKLPTANQLLADLGNDGSSVKIQMTLSDFTSTTTKLSVSGSAGLTIPIMDVFRLDLAASASYDLSTFTSQSSTVTVEMTFKGVTTAAAIPSPLSTDNATGWYAEEILSEVASKSGKDATGYQLIGSEFKIDQLFGPGKAFSRLKTFVVSQQPEVVMTFEAAEESRITSDLKVGAKLSLDLFGIFSLGSASADYEVHKVDTSSRQGAVIVTFSAPKPSGSTPLEQQKAYVMGGVPSYPPVNV